MTKTQQLVKVAKEIEQLQEQSLSLARTRDGINDARSASLEKAQAEIRDLQNAANEILAQLEELLEEAKQKFHADDPMVLELNQTIEALARELDSKKGFLQTLSYNYEQVQQSRLISGLLKKTDYVKL